MLKRAGIWIFLIAVTSWVAGCSTAPRRQETHWAEPVAVQAPVQQGPSAEDVERLRRQNEEQQAALARSEAEKRELENKLNDALASKKTPSKQTPDSYLK